MALVNVVDEGAIRYLQLNRPEVRNAFTVPMIADLLVALREFAERPDLRVAVLSGAGDSFCSGGDVRDMGARRPTPPERKHVLWDGVQRLARFVDAELDKPLVAMVNGAAVGAGLDLALMCDLRIARRDAVLSASYVRLALPPGNGAAWYLSRRAGRATALDLLWTGRRFSAEEGVGLGVIDFVHDPDDLRGATTDYCQGLAAQPLEAIRVIKRLVKQAETVPLAVALDTVSSHFAWMQETADHREGTVAFAEKRAPDFNPDHQQDEPITADAESPAESD
jgi:enoyl-CoA hydratase/carnithine racemase